MSEEIKYGRLQIIKSIKSFQVSPNKKRTVYLCQCDCGKQTIVLTYHLKSGHTSSCGCLHKEKFNNYKHGLKHHPLYHTWTDMKQRCLNPNNKRYCDYGGRGITVHDRWRAENGFVNFLQDMGERPEGKTLDRINNDGNYEPSNCRWATIQEQNLNTRRNVA